MTRLIRGFSIAVACLTVGAGVIRAQDSTFKGITITGVYDPSRDKIPIAILPISGAADDGVKDRNPIQVHDTTTDRRWWTRRREGRGCRDDRHAGYRVSIPVLHGQHRAASH